MLRRKTKKRRMGVREPATVTCERHLAWLRTLPCLVCGRAPSEAHHIIHGRHGGRLPKSDDRAVPLCAEHHRTANDSVHNLGHENVFFPRHGLGDRFDTAAALWAVSGDDAAGREIVLGRAAA